MEGVVYKIFCKDTTVQNCYVGSTKNLHLRKIRHKYITNATKHRINNYPLYQFIRCLGGFDNFDFEILEKREFADANELKECERKWFDEFKSICTLNSNLPFGRKEYKTSNYRSKEENQKRCFEYYYKNKELISKKQKEDAECDLCGKILRKNKITRHKRTSACKQTVKGV